MAYYIYIDIHGQWRWYLQGANKRKLADGCEGYNSEKECLAAIQLVKGSSPAPIHKVEK